MPSDPLPPEPPPRFSFTDDELLNFDQWLYPKYDARIARMKLERYGDGYRYQLFAASQIEAWANAIEQWLRDPFYDRARRDGLSEDFYEGFVDGIRWITTHLREGNLLNTLYPRERDPRQLEFDLWAQAPIQLSQAPGVVDSPSNDGVAL